MNFQMILIFLTLLSGILTDPGDRSHGGDQRRSLTGGDATLSKKRPASSGGDSTPQRQRLASGNATPSRQRLEEDVPLLRKRSASPGPSPPRHRLAGGDTIPYRQKGGDLSPSRRPPNSGGDASPQKRSSNSRGDARPQKRSFSSGGDANPPRRLSSPEKDASTPRRSATSRGDVSPPRSRPSSPTRVETSSRRLSITSEREQSTPRQRPSSSRLTNSVGDEYSSKHRSTNTVKDESLPRSQSTNSVRDESLSRQSSTNSAREESLSIQQFLKSMRDESPSKQWSANADETASPSRRRERLEESKKTSEFPMELTMSEKEKLLELGNMRDDMEKMQQEIVGMFKDLFWSSELTSNDMGENSLNAKSKETLQAVLTDGIQKITAKSDAFIDLIDKTSKALIKNAGAPGNLAEAAKKIQFLHKMKTGITELNEHYMRQIEKNLKGMIEMEKPAIGGEAISLRSSSRTTPVLRGHKGTNNSPRGEKKAT